jgi:hypothetical protein
MLALRDSVRLHRTFVKIKTEQGFLVQGSSIMALHDKEEDNSVREKDNFFDNCSF